jgi:hypothetical protein
VVNDLTVPALKGTALDRVAAGMLRQPNLYYLPITSGVARSPFDENSGGNDVGE